MPVQRCLCLLVAPLGSLSVPINGLIHTLPDTTSGGVHLVQQKCGFARGRRRLFGPYPCTGVVFKGMENNGHIGLRAHVAVVSRTLAGLSGFTVIANGHQQVAVTQGLVGNAAFIGNVYRGWLRLSTRFGFRCRRLPLHPLRKGGNLVRA